MDEYLTIKELSQRIKYNKQSIYNMINVGTLQIGRHYYKPTPKKILFNWTAMKDWIEKSNNPAKSNESVTEIKRKSSDCYNKHSSINI